MFFWKAAMSTFNRLQKLFSRQGIKINYQNGIYRLTNQSATASVLMPQHFPLEEKAVQQLLNFAAVQVPNTTGHVCKACATPDFHPGSIAPVGSIVATTEDLVIPAAIGTDINCGMRLLTTGQNLSEVIDKQQLLEQALTNVLLHDERNVPIPSQAFTALFEESPAAWLDNLQKQGIWQYVDINKLQNELSKAIGLDNIQASNRYAPEAFTGKREIIRPASLGTTGSGNHFVELQIVDKVINRHVAYQAGLREGEIVVMFHSGSRDVGFYVGQRWMDKAKQAWPTGVKHPESGLYGLTGKLAEEYLLAMGVATRYAWANRVVLAELVRQVWRTVFKEDKSQLVVDIPHNVVLQEQGMNIHRKGATPAYLGKLALIPGSMGDYSYVVMGLGNEDWLWSCSHGAGRTIRRQQMRAKRPEQLNQDHLPWHCITLKEARKLEEAPSAYKPVGPVIEAQQQAGLIEPVVRLKPWITFKA